jgi:hypothetical protein
MTDSDTHNPLHALKDDTPGGEQLHVALRKEKRLLNPIDRISEILFGLIMVLTFTCTISVAQTDRAELHDLLIGAVGCNFAWGLVDAVMFILTGLAEKGHGRIMLNYVRSTKDEEKARELIADALPPIVASTIEKNDLENIRKALLKFPESSLRVRVMTKDLKTALGVFLLVFLSTIPVALPFLIFNNVQSALRVSNLVAIILMFFCGWLLARYAGYNKWFMGIFMILLGIVLVALTIALGG